MTVSLSRSYPCRYGAPVLDRVDPKIFTLRYYTDCMGCTFCHDSCCQYGADIETPRITALEPHVEALEPLVGVPRAQWFRDDPDDIGMVPEPEYPGGEYTRTAVVPLPAGRSPHNEEACVFLDQVGRGCVIHRYALERNLDVHDIKPMVCLFFPLSHGDGELKPALEFEIDDLICMGAGRTLYESTRDEVIYYFGQEMADELDRLAKNYAAEPDGNTRVSLPVSSPV
ncbi:hypothetical protein [Limnoglobus roseus]|uniref:Uncharacterized protein n=1 Tax=Limnoglobus roseus TaxID=2598579 RepID=A0A5C1AN42_9BACT|nr:hypothetical protein [Limnoglobus roseus]QEL20400.1 hypothetical protein PX52LOC_07493 [Limnoglobus roseus]